MAYFDQVFNKLFPKKSEGPILHEVLKRSQFFIDQYSLWKASELSKNLLQDISESLRLKNEGIIKSPQVHAFSGNYSNGIAISYNSDIDKNHFRYLFDLLSEKVQALDYRVSISDSIVTEKNQYIETKEKHYLKIKPDNKTPIDQKYGNIIIELILIDDVPSFIRLMAHAYNDRLYAKPEKFENLANFLFHDQSIN